MLAGYFSLFLLSLPAVPPLLLEISSILPSPGVLCVASGICVLSEGFPDSHAVKPEIISHKRQRSRACLYFKENSFLGLGFVFWVFFFLW